MRKVLIVGHTGTIGQAIMKVLEDVGHQTVGVSRHSDPSLDIEDPDSISEFFAAHSGFDAICCAAGRAAFGSLGELTVEDYMESFRSKLLGQIRLVKAGLKHITDKGSILLTGGMLAYHPWPSTSAVAAVNAGLEGFVRAVAQDVTDGRKVGIIHPPLLAETARAMGRDATPWPSAELVAQLYLHAIEKGESGQAHFLENFQP